MVQVSEEGLMETPQGDLPGSEALQATPASESPHEELRADSQSASQAGQPPQAVPVLTPGATPSSQPKTQPPDKFQWWRDDARRVLNYSSQEAMAEHLMCMGDEHLPD
jgi:hypothetical protein